MLARLAIGLGRHTHDLAIMAAPFAVEQMWLALGVSVLVLTVIIVFEVIVIERNK